MSWPLVRLVREVDKVAAKLTSSEAYVLTAIALHTDASGTCWPSEERLAHETGLGERTVRRALVGLRRRGLVSVTVRRHWDPNRYTISEAMVASLPVYVTGHGGQRERPTATGREAMVAKQTGHGGLQRRREDKREEEGEEGAPQALPPPPPVVGSEMGDAEAFAIANQAADQHHRDHPTRGEKNREALRMLVRDAQAAARGAWRGDVAGALRARLLAHYAREDAGTCHWALKLATQVEQPAPRRRHEAARPAEPDPGALVGPAAAGDLAKLRAITEGAGRPPWDAMSNAERGRDRRIANAPRPPAHRPFPPLVATVPREVGSANAVKCIGLLTAPAPRAVRSG